VKIEKDIPVPPRRGRPPKYDFGALAVGESFFAPVSSANLNGCARRARASLPGRSFTVRAVTENGTRGARCWRVA
jgi:hypothetical protein